MAAHLTDSVVFGHLWATDRTRALYDDRGRTARWLRILAALAGAQADLGIVPRSSAESIAALDVDRLDLAEIGRRTRETSHSVLGLIGVLREALPDDAAEHVYHGATVQDVSDTSLSLEIDQLGRWFLDELLAIEETLLELAVRHRRTPMAGRTHGQPGAPTTFGLKVASWCDEIGRAVRRLRGGHERFAVVQLAGAVGNLAFFGDDGLALRARFAERLGLVDPDVSWTSCRDRPVEFATDVALAINAAARIANEIYSLQRKEIGELAEPLGAGTVGSITMPNKRNPERSEHVVTLAALVNRDVATLLSSTVHEHERDGRWWKIEWPLHPQIGLHADRALTLTRDLVTDLEVDTEAMVTNLGEPGDLGAEALLVRLSARLGKHRAQEALDAAFRRARGGVALRSTLAEIATEDELEAFDHPDPGRGPEMVDRVVAAARSRRSDGGDRW